MRYQPLAGLFKLAEGICDMDGVELSLAYFLIGSFELEGLQEARNILRDLRSQSTTLRVL
jgi:hypothetical protein